MTYKGYVSYLSDYGKWGHEQWSHEQGGFDSIEDATKWVADTFANLMLNWAMIDKNGIVVHGEVCDEGEEDSIGFTNMYDLRCGF